VLQGGKGDRSSGAYRRAVKQLCVELYRDALDLEAFAVAHMEGLGGLRTLRGTLPPELQGRVRRWP
jgi:hypothetical protein